MLTIFAFLFGAIIGSFLNVLIIRHGARQFSGRSTCLSCAAQIRWYDNIPIVSWFALRGRCRTCGSRISMQYPLVEALTGVLFALIAGGLGVRWEFAGAVEIIELVLTGVLAATFVAIAVYDARHTIIPDAWVYAAALLALALALLTSYAPLHTTLLSGPAAALPLFALWLISAGRWMGLGDAKLALAIGWMLGPLYGVVAIFLAFVVGAVISVGILMPLPYLRSMLQKTGIARWHAAGMSFTMKSEVAFGPFLVAAFFIVWLALLYELPLPL